MRDNAFITPGGLIGVDTDGQAAPDAGSLSFLAEQASEADPDFARRDFCYGFCAR